MAMRKLTVCIACVFCIFFSAGASEGYDWHGYNGHLYALTDGGKTWQGAESEAVSQGGHLVSINNSAEQNWLVSQFGGWPNSYWIGFFQLPGSEEPDKGWVWVSGEPVTFTNWANFDGTTEPNNGEGIESVAAMNEHRDGLWNDLPPDRTLPGVIEVSPIRRIEFILSFFDTSVDNGSLVGEGPGRSADERLMALRNMIKEAGILVTAGNIEEACLQLSAAYKKTDTIFPDFVNGPAASELAKMIGDLQTALSQASSLP
jgi:hypothetical protein